MTQVLAGSIPVGHPNSADCEQDAATANQHVPDSRVRAETRTARSGCPAPIV